MNIISWPRKAWQQKKIYIILFLCLPFIFAAGHFFTPSHHFLGIGELVSHHDHKFNNKAVLIIDISFSLLAARCGGHRILLWQRLQLYCGQWTLRLWSEVNSVSTLLLLVPSYPAPAPRQRPNLGPSSYLDQGNVLLSLFSHERTVTESQTWESQLKYGQHYSRAWSLQNIQIKGDFTQLQPDFLVFIWTLRMIKSRE